jgi:hypothetical protein
MVILPAANRYYADPLDAAIASAQVELLRARFTLSLMLFPGSFSLIGAGKTGFWPFQLTTPAPMAACRGSAEPPLAAGTTM